METERNRCPNCGRYLEDDPKGFYDLLDPANDMAPVVPFCDESCCDAYHAKQAAPPPCDPYTGQLNA